MTERLIDRLTLDQMEAILNALPIEFIFVDENDRLQYYNKGEKRTRPGPDDILGRDIRDCHKPESLARTDQMLAGFKKGKTDEDEFWIDGLGIRLLNRFLAVRDDAGNYRGCLEYLLDFDAMERMAEEKKDAFRFNANPAGTEKVTDQH
jgi:uncharacterized protein